MWAWSLVSTLISNIQDVISIFKSYLSWWIDTIFPPKSAIILEIVSSWPGLSVSSILRVSERPVLKRPLEITLDKIVTSILPPETRQTTFLPFTSTLLNIAAATETAPAPSATSFCCSISARIAVATSSSETVTISSTYCWHNSYVCSPGVLTAIPSAIVFTAGRFSISPSLIEFTIDGAPSAWTP